MNRKVYRDNTGETVQSRAAGCLQAVIHQWPVVYFFQCRVQQCNSYGEETGPESTGTGAKGILTPEKKQVEQLVSLEDWKCPSDLVLYTDITVMGFFFHQ